MKDFLRYLLLTILIGIVLYIGFRTQLYLRNTAATTFNLIPAILFLTLFPIFVGTLLRLPKFIQEIQNKKKWSINWAKLLTIGVPSLYVLFIPILLFYAPGLKLPFSTPILILDPTISSIIGVILGYVILDSLKKDDAGTFNNF